MVVAVAVVGRHLVAGRLAQDEDVLDVLLADRLPRRLGEDLHHHLDVFGADVAVRRARELVDLSGEGGGSHVTDMHGVI